jgi:hypothetical protein
LLGTRVGTWLASAIAPIDYQPAMYQDAQSRIAISRLAVRACKFCAAML